MTVCEELKKLLDESFAVSLKEKILYCLGYLQGDDENLDLYELFCSLLCSGENNPRSLEITFFSGLHSKCKECKFYKGDVLDHCLKCRRFNMTVVNFPDNFEKVKE